VGIGGLGLKILKDILRFEVILNLHQKSGGDRQNKDIFKVSLYHMILISRFYCISILGFGAQKSLD
jgi:hypothetical protein